MGNPLGRVQRGARGSPGASTGGRRRLWCGARVVLAGGRAPGMSQVSLEDVCGVLTCAVWDLGWEPGEHKGGNADGGTGLRLWR